MCVRKPSSTFEAVHSDFPHSTFSRRSDNKSSYILLLRTRLIQIFLERLLWENIHGTVSIHLQDTLLFLKAGFRTQFFNGENYSGPCFFSRRYCNIVMFSVNKQMGNLKNIYIYGHSCITLHFSACKVFLTLKHR